MTLIGMILALIFILVALVGPWYVVSYATSVSTMSLTSSTTTAGDTTETTSYADTKKSTESAGQDTGIFDIFNIALYLTIFALIVAILALGFLLGYSFNFGKPNIMKNLTMIFGIITFILAIVAVFYFMVALPGKMSSISSINQIGFWYSTSIRGNSISIGPGFAWYLMLIAGLIALISSIFVFMDKQAALVYQNPVP